MNHLKKLLHFLAVIFSALVLFAAGFGWYIEHYEKPWLHYENVPFPALKTFAYPGTSMPIHVVRCNDDKISHTYTITRMLERVVNNGEDREYMQLPDVIAGIQPGCEQGDFTGHIIPIGTRAGVWRLIGISEIRGTLHNHLVEWHSVPFEVRMK